MTSFSNFKSQLVSASTSAAGIELGGGGVTEYASTLEMPTTGIETGEMAYATSTNKLYMWNGNAWFNIAMVNQAPTGITGGSPSYQLAIDGTPTVVTLISTDPEGLPLTWSATTSGDTAVGTLTQADNVFTITPSTDEADVGTLSITFSVTDGTNTETATSVFTLAFVSPLWDETVLSIGTSSTNSLDNDTFIDRSTNAQTITPTGGPQQTAFHPYLDNWGVEFLANDMFTIPNHAGFDLSGSDDFTVESWIYRTGDNNQYAEWIVGKRATGSPYPFSWYIGIGAGNKFFIADNQGGVTSTTAFELHKWYHVAAVRESGTVKVYVDGVLENTGSLTISEVNTPLMIGNYTVDTPEFNGFISNLRIVKGTAVYTSPFTPSTEKLTDISGTSLLTCQSNRFIDASSNEHIITISGTPKISAFNPFGQESEYAVGQNKGSTYLSGSSKVDIPLVTALNAGTDSYSFELWVYFTSTNVNQGVIGTSSDGFAGFERSNGTWAYYQGSGATNTGVNATLNEWHHVVICRNGTSGAFFVDGQRLATFTDTGDKTNRGTFNIGYNGVAGGAYTIGYISDYRYIIGSNPYDGTQTTLTVPTAPVGNTNASLYLPFDNAGIFDKTGNHTLTLVGDTATSTTQTKFANTAMYFDGNDWISWNPPSIGPGDFTMEGWFYLSGTAGQGSAGQQGIFCAGNHGGSSKYSIKLHNTTPGVNKVMGFWLNSYTNEIRGSTVINTNQWYHYALVRSGSGSNNVKLYLDGTLEAQTTSTYSIPADTGSIGRNYPSLNAEYFNGYLENIQLLPGIAKYTTNFTPPTREQGRTYQAES